MKKILLFFSVFLLLNTACSNTSSNITELSLENFPHPKSTEILDRQRKDDYEIVFYTDETGYRIGYKKLDGEYWTHTGNGEINPTDGFDWVMNNDPTIPITLFGGIITDEKITTVFVKQKTMEKEAEIIATDEGLRFWFTTFGSLEEPDLGDPDQLKIEAFDDNGNILWKDGI
ncbi:hypothetical protein [Cytobacillus dafuensis]|uniref:Uncharacterized protein n=1 Tax=Cytobacillus dafuensis TaxID=1742359 RepID=A0A5B8Z284_CYTDA|nr:hypothetical protein [Cytobacillus dafuensis]QED46971.1 hypothetical protein FSZ17_06735 [Cytobacillus dafuensis]